MKVKNVKTFLLILIPATGFLIYFLFYFDRDQSWISNLGNTGTSSSPRVADLNDDGIGDIVMGTGKNEFQSSDTAVFALDGSTGEVLWTVPARDQIFASASFVDLNDDQTPDVVIGGRQATLKAIDGRTGAVIWEFLPEGSPDEKEMLYNFYNAIAINDLNSDHLPEILVSSGGNVLAAAGDTSSREPGRIRILNGKDGSMVSEIVTPDGRETYMSPVLYDFNDDGEDEVIFGTGGESIGGGLYKIKLKDVIAGDHQKAKLLVEDEKKGFIAPVTLADITKDGVKDIVANAYGGSMYAINGANDCKLWKVEISGTEVNSTPAPGYFNSDDIPDFFAVYGRGVYPDLREVVRFMVDGETGKIQYRDSIGCFQSSSPVVYDFNQDGHDDVLTSVNIYNCFSTHLQNTINKLQIIDFKNDTAYQAGPSITAKNISTTPWIGDLDGDSKLDIVYSVMAGTTRFDDFSGLRVLRIETDYEITEPVKWGAYMGSDYDGIFKN